MLLPHTNRSGPRRSARQSTPRPPTAQLTHLKSLLQDPAYRHLLEDPDAFSPEITGLHSPLLLPAMEQAVAYLHQAITTRGHIVVIGDRDVDGVSSTATMGNFLKEQHVAGGGSLEMIVSDDGDDYGLSGGVFERALNSGAELSILLDMGTSNGPEIEQLHAQGIRTIVLDHHQLHERTANPEHCAFVNPMRSPENERLEHAGKIATAGLVFKFLLGYALSHTKDWYRAYTVENETNRLLAYRCGQFLGEFSSASAIEHFLSEQDTPSNRQAWEVLPLERHYRITPETRMRILENPRSNGKYILAAVISGRPRLREFALRYADLAAVGIVTDMVPLIGENRALVRMGIGRIGAVSAPGHRSYCPGYAALIQAMNLNHARVVSRDLSWSIGPALNAAGRMGNTRLALNLLTCREEPEAKRLARELVRLNEERRRRTARNEALVNQLVEQESRLLEHPILFLYHADLEPGVSGIVATRMVEKHLRPVVYINPDGDYARGSIRTFQQVNVLHLLDAARDLFIQFGGHPEAAGFSIEYDRIPELKSRLLNHAGRVLANDPMFSGSPLAASTEPPYHLEILPGQLNRALLKELDLLEPFGTGNPEPVFKVQATRLINCKLMSDGLHARFQIHGAPAYLDCVAWRQGAVVDAIVQKQQSAWLFGSLEMSYFRGRARLQFRVDRVLPHEAAF